MDMSDAPFKIFVGWDQREDIAFQVCRASMLRHSTTPLDVIALRQPELRQRRLYWRSPDPLASTEFTYTRFLVPVLAEFRGWALFCDCDFLWLDDVAKLVALRDDRYAVMCVQHDHRPAEAKKMDGRIQTVYPRKNWSSLVLYHCSHPANRALSADVVNRESGAFLHQFRWLDDKLIGPLPKNWNWLEGWDQAPINGVPSVVHFTRGGPWFEHYKNVTYAELWQDERNRLGDDCK